MVVTTRVESVMQRTVVTVDRDTTVRAAARRLREADAGSVIVCEDSSPVGIVTESDLVGLLARDEDPDRETVADVMSAPVITVPAAATVLTAGERLREHHIEQVPVLDDGELVGVLSAHSLWSFLPRVALEGVPEPPGETRDADWEADYEDRQAEGVSVGDVVRFSKRITDAEVRRFASLSGDTNPLHLDDEYAAGSRFGERIVHGALAGSVISAALARLPGLVIYLGQDLHFLEPVPVGERVTAVCEVIEHLGERRFRLSTDEFDEDDEQVIGGEAVVLVDPAPETEHGAVAAPGQTERDRSD